MTEYKHKDIGYWCWLHTLTSEQLRAEFEKNLADCKKLEEIIHV